MGKSFKTFFVVNPKAGRGRGKKLWEQAKKQIERELGECDYEYTNSHGHGIVLTTEALKQGYELIVAFGGDGTINEVVNGFFEEGRPVSDGAVLGFMPSGTGSDYIRSVDYPKTLKKRIAMLKGRETRTVDLGQVAYQTLDGIEQTRLFVNVAGCGLPGELVDEVEKVPRHYSGRIAYLLGVARALRRHKNKRIEVKIDGSQPIFKKALCTVIANGQYFGSGMHIAPDAILDDGWLDFILVGDVGWADLIRHFPMLYTGNIRNHPKVEVYRAKEVKISSEEQVLLDVDGELPGCLPATYRVFPRALKVKV